MFDSCNIHMIKDLVKGLEEHAHRSQLVYQQHIDILKGRLLDRDDQIQTLNRQLSYYKGGELMFQKTDRHRKSTSRGKVNSQFDQCLKESRKSLSVLFKSKIEQFQQIIHQKSSASRIQTKKDIGDINEQQHRKLLGQIAQLRNDKQIYQKQLEAQSKLIKQYQQQNQQKIKEFKNYKLKSRQNSKNETKKIIDLYTEKYKQLNYKYSSLFTDLTFFLRNELDTLKKQSMDGLSTTWEALTTNLIKFSEQLPYRSQNNRVNSEDSSILSKEQVLEFEIEELRKELLTIKAQNCVMKFQLKRKDQKKTSQKTQPLFDKNKFFGQSVCENQVKGSLKFQRTRKDTSRGKSRRCEREADEQERQQMMEIKEKIKNLNNSDMGRKSMSRRKF